MAERLNTNVMVAGHICLDITPGFDQGIKGGFDQIFRPGKLINVNEAVIGTGGAVSNTGLAMSKLGLNVMLNGKVGDDAFGSIIKQLVGKERAASFKTVSGQSSSYSVVLSLPGVDRIFLHHPGTNDTFGAEDVDYGALSTCSLFHFGYPSLMKRMFQDEGRELVKIFKKAKECGVITSLDMTLPDPDSESGKVNWKKVFADVLPYVDIFLPSVEEIAYMLDKDLFDTRKRQAGSEDPVLVYQAKDCSSLADKLIAMGAAIVAIKNGIKGYYLKTAKQERLAKVSIFKKSQIDCWFGREMWAGSYKALKFGSATGAGDATIAGFLTALLRGLDPVESLKVANTLGWQNVREVDALGGIEDWQTTIAMVQDKARQRNPLTIEEKGWKFSEADQVFYGPNDAACKS